MRSVYHNLLTKELLITRKIPMKWHLATGFVSFLTCWDSIYTSARMNQVSATIKKGSPVLVWAWNFFCLFWYRTTTLVKQSSVDPIALQNLPLIIVDVLVGTTKIPYTLRKSYLSFSRLKNALKKILIRGDSPSMYNRQKLQLQSQTSWSCQN